MKYFWVNQKQTYKQEVPGGYLWSPKTNRNGAKNRSYEWMREVTPGDVIFSYANGFIKAVGVAKSYCYEFPKPVEFGKTGDYWANVGWRVEVSYRELFNTVSPKENIHRLRPFLPEKYSPLRYDGNGNQNFYLLKIDYELAVVIASLVDESTVDLVGSMRVKESSEFYDAVSGDNSIQSDPAIENIKLWEDKIEQMVLRDSALDSLERDAVVKARRGQGMYRKRLGEIEKCCRITRVDRSEYLVASHTKPWRDCENSIERLDPENGFMLTRSIDHLFDRGFISFEDNGRLIVSPVAHKESLKRIGVPIKEALNVGKFTEGQRSYLDWHREKILLKSSLD